MDPKQTLMQILPGRIVVSGHRADHLQSDCPFCLKQDHFYVNFERAFKRQGKYYLGSWDCKKCGATGVLPTLLKQLGRLDLIQTEKPVVIEQLLVNKLQPVVIEEEIDVTIQPKRPPMGWRRVQDDVYLRTRGFDDNDFNKYQVGYTNMVSRLKGYLIIIIIEQEQCVGYIARSLLDKMELKRLNDIITQHNTENPHNKKRKHLRYDNSPNTDFSHLLVGYDEINHHTTTVILVEGFFDKHNVDKLLKLDEIDTLKCTACFGKKISRTQIYKLRIKGVQNIIVLYDPDAVNSSKKYSLELEKYFNVEVGYLKDKDPGDLTLPELQSVMNNLQKPAIFVLNRLQKNELE